jgi:hypothetical protein
MYGTPVITHSDLAFQMPEVEAIVEGVTGLLFDRGTVQSLAHCLRRIPEAFPERDRTRVNCFKVVDQVYNPRKQCEVLAEVIRGRPARCGDDMASLYGAAYD